MLLTNTSDLLVLIEFNYSAVTNRIVMYKICSFIYVKYSICIGRVLKY
jgi:hypothetical protein